MLTRFGQGQIGSDQRTPRRLEAHEHMDLETRLLACAAASLRAQVGDEAIGAESRRRVPCMRQGRRTLRGILVGLALLVLGVALPTQIIAAAHTGWPTMADPLPIRVRYARTLIADAAYQLALTPRVFTLWHWRIAVWPAHPDPQRAWDAIRRIPPLIQDQPAVPAPSLAGHIQRTFAHLDREAMLARQAQEPYTADYAPVRTLLATLDTDLSAALSAPASAASEWGACPVCPLE
jgi:hypothetical protein